jgi:hypothetical protein
MKTRRRHAAGKPAQQRQRVHLDRDRAVGVRALECDAHQVTSNARGPLLRERRSQHVAQQRLAPGKVQRASACGRVQREAIE